VDCRLPALTEETLDLAQHALLAAMRAGPRGGALSLRGPFGVFLHAPAFGSLAQELGAHCRFGTTIPARLSEFAILVTARLWRAQYEWHVHAPIAAKAGVPPAHVEALAQGRRPDAMDADHAAVHDFLAELFEHRAVSDPTYARALERFGERGVIDLTGLAGYYATLAMVLNVARTPLPDGSAPQLDR
jgi:4-carboxymuconolactone decarboxylase